VSLIMEMPGQKLANLAAAAGKHDS
jgi:hypothetical protein